MEAGQTKRKEKRVFDTDYGNWEYGTGEWGKLEKGQLLEGFVSHGTYLKIYSKGN